MKSALLILRSLLLWLISGLHFFVICTFLVLLGTWVDPRRNDRPQRWFFRNVLRLAGVDFEVRFAPGFDRTRTSIFVSNHVNIFDPFVIYSAIPQFVRGLELESHFKVPVYGWMMKRFGNIPVPETGGPSAFKTMMRRTKAALDDGVSLIVFAEGSRTRTGRVGPFNQGAFMMAQRFGYPIVPISIVGSYAFHRTGDWMLRPSKIVVHLHDTIDTDGLPRDEVEPLRVRVHQLVSGPVDHDLDRTSTGVADPPTKTDCR
ncbi:MAG: 1-acyl-sn-glycerol-3-phosphate acyltransferase [Acidobacteria bacterium]|nr:1-acyl-sn-glycerol-3-phosphate acyltransferase [Acidobacteriota bacterium]